MKDQQDKLRKLIEKELYDLVPFKLAVIDHSHNILFANKNFENYFGDWEGRKCYHVYKNSPAPCQNCKLNDLYRTGEVQVSNESGYDSKGKPCHYVVHLSPLKNEQGEIEYVLEMSTDLTETNLHQKEFNILFEKVPCYMTIIDKNYRIVRCNEKFEMTFGDSRGKFCYEVYKKRKSACKNCPAALTFNDGKEHVSTEIGLTEFGEESNYIVTTTPLSNMEGDVNLVIEIANDITELTLLQEKIKRSNDFYATLINNSATGIIAINKDGRTEIFNPAVKKILEWRSQKKPGFHHLQDMLPTEFFNNETKNGNIVKYLETKIKTHKSNEVPVKINAVELKSKNEVLGRAAFIEDLREIKELEKQKLDAERLSAVGQTVAGLAHTIKNLLMGLEGGVYMVDTGLKQNDAIRILEGWEVLQKNLTKTTSLVKDFLSFAKGRLPVLQMADLNNIISDIVELYKEAALNQGVTLIGVKNINVKRAPLDPEGIEACLTNLISNGIDAATQREFGGGKVYLKLKEIDDEIIFEVTDNGCGMDSEVIQRLFTTFFTTKGGKGTGLGLLTTRKIVQEHGGRIEVDSRVNKGSNFSIILPRKRLNLIYEESKKLKEPTKV